MPRLKQQYLTPEMEPPQITEVVEAAEHYVEVRDARMRLTEQEVEAHATLLETMRKHNLNTYSFDGYLVLRIPGQEKVKVKTKKDGEDNTLVEVFNDTDQESDSPASPESLEPALPETPASGGAVPSRFLAIEPHPETPAPGGAADPLDWENLGEANRALAGKVIENHNATLDWWNQQSAARKQELLEAQKKRAVSRIRRAR